MEGQQWEYGGDLQGSDGNMAVIWQGSNVKIVVKGHGSKDNVAVMGKVVMGTWQ